jgi:hypothetical protein
VSGVTVVVDFGATDTVGVLRRRGDVPRPIVVDGENSVPSVVALSPSDQLVVGREAAGLEKSDQPRVVRNLRDRLDRHDLMVGDIVLPVTRLVRALLSRVVRAAGEPVSQLVLTHPADWPAERVEVLTRAAVGLAPSIRTALSPLAAAAGAGVDADQNLLVFELDGDSGTVTAVRRRSGKLGVLSTSEMPPEGELAKLVTTAGSALVVGRSARVPAFARRLAELGGSMRVDPDPATAVARGALELVGDRPVRRLSGRSRSWLRRSALVAAGFVIVAAVSAVLALGSGPGLRMAGSPGPAAGALVEDPDVGGGQTIPPAVEGEELVTAGKPSYETVRAGQPARYRTVGGAELDVAVKDLRPARVLPVLGEVPAGYRWLIVELTGANRSGPDWDADYSRGLSLIDDRGLWIRPLGDGVIECKPGAGKPPEVVKAGERFDACVALPVPERTPVKAVVFGSPSDDPKAQRPIQVPVDAPAVSPGVAPTPQVAGTVGDPPVEITLADTTMRAGFDLVTTPSGYVGDRRPAPGNKFVVVRAALGSADDVFLRDDRGVLSRPSPGFDRMPECPPFLGPGTADRPVYACFVYELAAEAIVAGVTYGDLAPEVPLSGKDIERWPTWTVG